MAFLDLCFRRHVYHSVARLHGHRGAINALAFMPNGLVLASGSDDESIKLWSTGHAICLQTLIDGQESFGEVKALCFIGADGQWLVSGTGRGLVCVYERTLGGRYYQTTSVLGTSASNDPVESLAFDPGSRCLAVTSHNGAIVVYNPDFTGIRVALRMQWSSDVAPMIPRSCAFVSAGKDLFVFGLNTGDITTLSATTGEMVSRHHLGCPIGSAAVDSKGSVLLLQNVGDSFELYDIRSNKLIHIIPADSTIPFLTDVKFTKSGAIAAGGSATGKVRIIHIGSGSVVQELNHGRGILLLCSLTLPTNEMELGPVQALDMASTCMLDIIASGSSADLHDIRLWAKPTRLVVMTTRSLYIVLLALSVYYTFQMWMPWLNQWFSLEVATASIGRAGCQGIQYFQMSPVPDLDLHWACCCDGYDDDTPDLMGRVLQRHMQMQERVVTEE
ncbi:WD40-repeat-containing domain protein [Desarmillaria tabescens]|uniref:WD40-repeat-containing domain protein n=1 Tax=Armillaria tabescens TaxID=1929756 RepID=A0AA39MIN8_ARMTA|nr:WD40-repeat-containing domain protein [Desarmillaria tabescens]KAK0436306.1 WD40-repeat-containing domain protein [Desarmillaria tabescens]